MPLEMDQAIYPFFHGNESALCRPSKQAALATCCFGNRTGGETLIASKSAIFLQNCRFKLPQSHEEPLRKPMAFPEIVFATNRGESESSSGWRKSDVLIPVSVTQGFYR